MSLFSLGADITEFRSRLGPVIANLAPGQTWTDAQLLAFLKSSEAQISQRLGVKLEPTQVFTDDPTDAQITALADLDPPIAAWIVEPGYDFDPAIFEGERWGRIDTRQLPIISVNSVAWAYPTPANLVYTVPPTWLRVDRKYGAIQMVPSGQFGTAPLSVWVLSVLGGGLNVPFMIRIDYVCGLKDARTDYPNLIDAIYKNATIMLINGLFLPSGGSISADGLSMSQSIKVQDWQDQVDYMLFGPKGSNGGLRQAILGATVMVC